MSVRQHWRYWCRARTATWIAKGRRAPTERVSIPHFQLLPHLVLPSLASTELRFLTTPAMELFRNVVRCLTRRNAHELHFIHAFDAASDQTLLWLLNADTGS